MRIQQVALSWFRGAAKDAVLVADGRSIVVFGTNGAGKSSFVDGVEASIRQGKVQHAQHEYSGYYLEKALINTHRPADQATTVSLSLHPGPLAVTTVWTTGKPQQQGANNGEFKGWDYRRVALRQDELAEFIKSPKGDRYSAILPLLGLQPLETAAENLRRLVREVLEMSKLEDMRSRLAHATERRVAIFGNTSDLKVSHRLDQLVAKHLPADDTVDADQRIKALAAAIDEKLGALDGNVKQASSLQELKHSAFLEHAAAAIRLADEINMLSEPLIEERLKVLTAADQYQLALDAETPTLKCPACGIEQPAHEFRSHIAGEIGRLHQAQRLFHSQRHEINQACDELAQLRRALAQPSLLAWRDSLPTASRDALASLDAIQMSTLRDGLRISELRQIASAVTVLFEALQQYSPQLSTDAQELLNDKEHASAIAMIAAGAKLADSIRRVEGLIAFLRKLESEIRSEIRTQAEAIFATISSDIQRLWLLLHPSKKISAVRLLVPEDAEKAIDVVLTFHGVAQASPRLTLSEGQRNGLGLAIFLAMAKQDTGDRPMILDDVVVSLDREHRSQVARILESEFRDRQVLVFTHDREWYFELTRVLDRTRWQFRRLNPWVGPDIGISFAEHATDFAKARSKVDVDPEDALSNVRRLMDVGLADIAEKLEIPMPYLRGDANDRRTAGEYLPRIASRAKTHFRMRNADGSYPKNSLVTDALAQIATPLATWSNTATHTFSGSSTEASQLIDDCETALLVFNCDACSKPVWSREDTAKGHLSCACGKFQWRE